MAKQVQLRRGSASDHTTFTGAVGELTYVSDDKTLRIHDGSTAGGIKAITEGTGTTDISNDLAVNTDKMTVASATGNTAIAGTLDVTGNITGGASSVLYVPGSIVQVQYTQTDTTDATTVPLATTTDIPNLSVVITPKSTASKILIEVMWNGEVGPDVGDGYNTTMFLKRDATELKAATDGDRLSGISGFMDSYNTANRTPDSSQIRFFDTPASTSAITYKVVVKNGVDGGTTVYTNRTEDDTDSASHARMISNISVTEIAG